MYIGWVLFIALLTLLPGSAFPGISWNFLEIDKLVHITVFAIMVFIGTIAFGKNNRRSSWVNIGLSLLLAVLYGTSLEYTQALIPDRSFDYADLVANYGGCLLGILGYRIYYNFL